MQTADQDNQLTSSYTLLMFFWPFLYMFKISRKALYTLSSVAKRVCSHSIKFRLVDNDAANGMVLRRSFFALKAVIITLILFT